MLAHTGKRLTTRITDHVREKLQVAADIVGATLNQFVVQAALEKADKVIESESTIVLTRRESLRLLELIENPPSRFDGVSGITKSNVDKALDNGRNLRIWN